MLADACTGPFPFSLCAYTLMHMHTFPHGCSCFAVRRLARRITRFYDRHLAEEGLRTTQYSLLSHLRGREGLAMRELAARLDMDRSTLNRNVRPLIAAGWIIQRAGADPRVAVLELTDAGRRKQAAARARWAEAQAGFEASLGAAAVARLHAGIDAASAALPDEP